MVEVNVEAMKYTRSFQPGVVADEAPPLYVTIFERGIGASAIATLLREHHDLPTDGWSAAMEHQLGRYFEAQPEISTTRVSVSCRQSQCLLQFMELPQKERPASSALTMLDRLKEEPWYREDFLDGGRFRPVRVSTRGDMVQYMGLTLNRQPVPR